MLERFTSRLAQNAKGTKVTPRLEKEPSRVWIDCLQLFYENSHDGYRVTRVFVQLHIFGNENTVPSYLFSCTFSENLITFSENTVPSYNVFVQLHNFGNGNTMFSLPTRSRPPSGFWERRVDWPIIINTLQVNHMLALTYARRCTCMRSKPL